MTFEEYKKKYFEGLENGEAKLKGIRRALDDALEQQDYENALSLYEVFMKEDVFHGSSYKAVLTFPENVALFEEHPELQEEYSSGLMWSYKWILDSVSEFVDIPLSQIEDIFNQYAEFCRRFNFSLRTYYQIIWNTIIVHQGEEGTLCGLTAREAHKLKMKSMVDDLSDCRACEHDDDVCYLLKVEKDMERAMRKAEPILNGKLHCANKPHTTYSKLAYNWLKLEKDPENAQRYAIKAIRLFNRDYGNEPSLMGSKADCVYVLAYTDTERALRYFKKILPYIPQCSSDSECFDVWMAAYHLFMQLEKLGTEKVRIRLPFRDEDIYNESGMYETAALKDFFYQRAKSLADRFDERNGNDLFNKNLCKTYEFPKEVLERLHQGAERSVLERIRDNLDEEGLVPGFSLAGKPQNEEDMVFADGAMDGIFMYHTREEAEEPEGLYEILLLAGQGSRKEAVSKAEEYFTKSETRIISIVDAVQQFIIQHQEEIPPRTMYAFAVELVTGSVNSECVKLGLCILELFDNYSDELLEAFDDLAVCDEFTLYCMWIYRSLDDGMERLFKAAKNVHGWGRIFAVTELKPENEEIRSWMLEEGMDNDVYPGYSAIPVFDKSDAHSMLERGLSQEELTPVGKILAYLVDDEGPTIGIKAYDDGDDIVSMYLDAAGRLDKNETDMKILRLISERYTNEELCERAKEIIGDYEFSD